MFIYFKVCLLLIRVVRRMYVVGFCYSDLSYKNVFIDLEMGYVCIIDVDGLVVSGKYFFDVVGILDFIVSEVVKISYFFKEDLNCVLLSIIIDCYVLLVFIYMYLFFCYLLCGGKIYDMLDEVCDEILFMGEKVFFIEYLIDKSNVVKVSQLFFFLLFWVDLEKIFYIIMGFYLMFLFECVFIDGLYDVIKCLIVDEWESVLVKIVDLIQFCQNKVCEQKWYVFLGKIKLVCFYCSMLYKGKLLVLNLYLF